MISNHNIWYEGTEWWNKWIWKKKEKLSHTYSPDRNSKGGGSISEISIFILTYVLDKPFFIRTIFIRSSRLKISNINNKLRIIPGSESMAQGKIKEYQASPLFSLFIRNNLGTKLRT